MGTPLTTGSGTAGPPAASLPEVYVYGSNPRVAELNFKGEPKKQVKLTALVIKSDGATRREGDDSVAIEAGEVVAIYIGGYAKWDPDQDKLDKTHKSWSEVVGGGLAVGYVGQWQFLGMLEGQGAQPRKDRKFRLRADKPEELAQTTRCEELRRELQERTVLVPAGGPAEGPFDDAPSSVADDF
jgi:hypothetical protein